MYFEPEKTEHLSTITETEDIYQRYKDEGATKPVSEIDLSKPNSTDQVQLIKGSPWQLLFLYILMNELAK